eukprot:COSAG05_NODE_12418_length_468_cov_6.018970_1_plen_80_part_00
MDCVAHYICACIAAAFSLTPLPVAALAFLRSYRTLLPPRLLLLLPSPVVSFPTTFILLITFSIIGFKLRLYWQVSDMPP